MARRSGTGFTSERGQKLEIQEVHGAAEQGTVLHDRTLHKENLFWRKYVFCGG